MSEDTELLDNEPVETTDEDVVIENGNDLSKEQLEAKNRRLYARAKKAEDEAREAKKKLESINHKPSGEVSNKVPDVREYVDLRMEGYAEDEIEAIERFAKANKVSLKEAKMTPFVQGGIQALRQSKNQEGASPAPSAKPALPSSSKKPWASMTKEERQAAFATKGLGAVR
jgi:hypothetical protein